MKSLTLAVLMALTATPHLPGQETVLPEHTQISGFSGPYLRLTDIDGELGIILGGRGGLTIGHSFVIGGYGGSRVNDENLSFTEYGGFLEYVFLPMKPVHFSVAFLVGGGYAKNNGQSDLFFSMEPEAWLMFNITRKFQVGLGPSYRWVTALDIAGVELNGLGAGLIFKLGKF